MTKVCRKINLLVENSGQVQLLTGDSKAISHMGECQLTGGEVLKDVLCVPFLNLILCHFESERGSQM